MVRIRPRFVICKVSPQKKERGTEARGVVADKRREMKNEKVKRRAEGAECTKRGDETTQTARPK